MTRHITYPLIAGLALITLLLPCGTLFAADESVCLQCHANLELELSEPVGLWKESIHAQNGITCHDCHGGDPSDFAMAMMPESGFIGVPSSEEVPGFCGRCHIGVKDDYLASAHGMARLEGGPHCVNCHGNHRVKAASLNLIDPKLCSNCHSYERAAELKTALESTEDSLSALDGEIANLFRLGVVVRDKQDALFAVRNDFRRLAHTVNVEKVTTETAEFAKRIGDIQAEVDGIYNEMSQRKIVGAVVVVLLLLTGGVALLIRKSYEEEEKKQQADE